MYYVGQKVWARWKIDAEWYEAEIIAINLDEEAIALGRAYKVRFVSGEPIHDVHFVRENQLKPYP